MKPVFGKIRRDLEVTNVVRGGRSLVVIKDPVAHRFYEMEESDYMLALCFDENLSPSQQIAQLRAQCPDWCAGESDARILSRTSRIAREIQSTGLSAGADLSGMEPSKLPAHSSARALLRKIAGLLFLRFRLADPTAVLDCLNAFSGLVFRRWFLWFVLAAFAFSFPIFWFSGGSSSLAPAWLSRPEFLAGLYFGIVLLKFFHEAAHALAIRHFGGGTHEVGVILVAGLPLFYVEASDSYRFPNKYHRMVVASAGILAELFLAVCLMGLWAVLADGVVKEVVSSLVIVAGVSTIVFNGNPLMRFDGYYLLADAVDIPDLRQKAGAYISQKIVAWVAPAPSRNREKVPKEWLLALYGLASPLYLVLVILGVWLFLSITLEPLGLKWIGDSLVAAWAVSSILLPGLGHIKKIWRQAGIGRGSGPARRKILALVVLTLGLVAAFVPFPRNIVVDGEIEPGPGTTVRASEAGFVKEVYVREGSRVKAGEPVALMESPVVSSGVLMSLAALKQSRNELRVAMSTENTTTVGLLRREVASVEARLEEAKRKENLLVLRSPVDGRVVSRKPEDLAGRYLAQGDIFCVIQRPGTFFFEALLDQQQARMVKPGARAHVRLNSFPTRTLSASVQTIPLRLPPPDGAANNTAQPFTHSVLLKLESPPPDLRIGMTGKARIYRGNQSFTAAAFSLILDFVHLDVRMR